MSRSDRYTRTAVALHWLIAALLIGQFAWGWWVRHDAAGLGMEGPDDQSRMR